MSQTILAAQLPNGRTQFFGPSASPLTNGQVAFFVPGTTTPKDTWIDPYQAVVNPNPVDLDENGTAVIWGSGLYRQIAYDSNGQQIWDELSYANAGSGASTTGFGAQTQIGSAALIQLADATGHNALITGNITIASFGDTADTTAPIYLVTFSGALTLTNSTSLICLANADMSISSGDAIIAEYLGVGVWQILFYQPFAGNAVLSANQTWTGTNTFSQPITLNGAPTNANSGGTAGIVRNEQDGTYTFALSDIGRMVRHNSASAHTYTIPPHSSIAFDIGATISLRNYGAGTLSIARGSGVTLRLAGSSTSADRTITQWGLASLYQEDTDVWVISGTNVS